MMEKNAKIYVAGHRGMVGSAIVRELERQGYTNIITRTHKELDLTRQDAVEKFFAEEKELWHSGEIAVASGLKISYVPQSAEFLRGSLRDFAREWSLDETLFLAMLRKLDLSRDQFEKGMENYSQGQKKKVLLAKSLCEKAHVYVWDEPLNYIDIFTRMQLEDMILEYSPTMIFVEHDRAFADKIATKKITL